MNTRIFFGSAALASTLLAALPVAADDFDCRAKGVMLPQGALTCLRLPIGDQLARCDRVVNNPSWSKVQDGCESGDVATGSDAASAEAAKDPAAQTLK
ncbi:hypothetical protein GA830_12935 [Mesorhizobium sp. NBSH29]|uniref:hypothetical protein n=1 Tax=Mesorhizobium sp. NBSH29 TaxID=2654249 RepID=UPI001896A2B4|nr:hypothetical protein [Mesorhizobium sp. NBSH29]QPC87552.1 hypothetical protein GA830_12935 [Mesorhizobium sp. NBSH29]